MSSHCSSPSNADKAFLKQLCTVKKWMAEEARISARTRTDRRRLIVLKVQVGEALLANKGQHGLADELGIDRSVVGDYRAIARAWAAYAAAHGGVTLADSSVPDEWVETLSFKEIFALGRSHADVADQGETPNNAPETCGPASSPVAVHTSTSATGRNTNRPGDDSAKHWQALRGLYADFHLKVRKVISEAPEAERGALVKQAEVLHATAWTNISAPVKGDGGAK